MVLFKTNDQGQALKLAARDGSMKYDEERERNDYIKACEVT